MQVIPEPENPIIPPLRLDLLETMICPKCGRKLFQERLNLGSGRVACICGFSNEYYFKVPSRLDDVPIEIFQKVYCTKNRQMPKPKKKIRFFICKVCKKEFTLLCFPKQEICGSECRTKNIRINNLAWYYKKRGVRPPKEEG